MKQTVTQENTPNAMNAADDPEQQRKFTRTRDSVKSNTESVSICVCDTEKSEEKKISRRQSVKDKKRGSSPEINCASADVSKEKVAPRKRPSIKSDQPLDASPEEATVTRRASRKSSKRSSVKSGTGKLDDRDSSTDDLTCASEISVAEEAKPVSRTRDSLKSVDGKERGASPDISWASEEPSLAAGGAEISKSGSSLKVKGNEDKSGKASPDISCASDGTDLTKSRGSLKSKSAAEGSSKSSVKSKSKKSETKEEALKAKFQQPLISLKTDGLFGKKKE